ncbi:BTAD domain-containing putative transcriptional regulator [Umezawaea sp. Da 62-37]|uniref:AfsR/SARP family transcriptional regulator n=1 Tax=Umezawaea sp. Da 62-37 TaxID=3075927 RepID=UPI0028F710BF|nr:BTAD domain-containing putative transcriptional regulator [Umezawaea sp. Da 62-37]WNV92189.1 BTAD domain-containing putative transcriptional regulator [Umezawaea sp. Da 62-37]
MRLRVLGALDLVDVDGTRVTPAAGKQRVLLALLLLHADEWVSVDRLVDALWGDAPPVSAAGNLKTYVWKLRRLVGDDRIVHDRNGYRVRVTRAELDVSVFEDLVAEGRRARPERAVEVLGEALELWRGDPFEELSGSVVDAVRARLAEQRLTAHEHLASALVALGRHDDAIAALRELVTEHPFREHLRGILISALHEAGRSAEALEVYEEARAVLDAELGLLPGAELRRLHAAVLNQDAPARTEAPIAQLPAAPRGFVGRDEAQRALDVEPDEAGAVHVLTGTAGVGKSALALHWAHRNRARFPDGQLFVNLRGHSAGAPLTARQALEELLQALDVDPTRRPAGVDGAAGAYRSALADRRVLVLLDDAVDVGQVRPLLPGTAACTVLVTSRNRLDGLVVHEGARQQRLGALDAEDARAVLDRVVGRTRVAAEPGAAAELVALCGGLPLALRIAAAHLAAQPDRPIGDYTAALRTGDRLAALELHGDPTAAVGPAIDLSYAARTPSAQRVFRLIGLVPGPDVTARAVAALADVDLAAAEHGLRDLVAANLLDQPAPGRYALHELLRLHAAARAAQDGHEPLERLLTWYAATAETAADALDTGRVRLPGALERHTRAPLSFDGPAAALDWFTAEAPDLAAVVDLATATGRHRLAWQVAEAAKGFFLRGNTAQWATVVRSCLRAAEADDHPHARFATNNSAGLLDLIRGEYTSAIGYFQTALEWSVTAQWPLGTATALSNLGLLHFYTGPLALAFDHLRRAEEISGREQACLVQEGVVLINLGTTAFKLGRPAEAVRHLARALAAQDASGNDRTRGEALLALAEVHLHVGDLGKAADLLDVLASHVKVVPVHYETAWYLDLRARLAALLGDLDRASVLLTEAVEVANGHHGIGVDTQNSLGVVHSLRSRFDDAEVLHRRALTAADHSRYLQGRIDALLGLVAVHRHRGDFARAAQDATAALDLALHTGHRHHQAQALAALAAVHLGLGDHRAGAEHAERARHVHIETGHRLGEARALLLLAEAAARDGDPTGADRHALNADHLLTTIGVPHDTRLSALS